MTRSKLMLIVTIIGCLMIIGLSIGIHYSRQIKVDSRYQECEWVGDYLENGCIHHHIFYLIKDEIKVSVVIDPEICEINNPYQENVTYWCGKIENKYQVETKEQYRMADSQTLIMLICFLSMIVIMLPIAIFAHFASPPNDQNNVFEQPVLKPPSYRETKKRRGPIKPPNITPSEFNKQMPVWSV